MKKNSKRLCRVMSLMIIMGTLGVPGCASYRVYTSLGLSNQPVPRPNNQVYRIAAVHFLTPTNVTGASDSDFGTYKMPEDALQEKLMTTALSTYPNAFSADAEAIPLDICITRVSHEGNIGADACVSCITLTILPIRTGDITGYTVQTSRLGERQPLSLVEFHREDMGWMSLLPTGWIPVPGGKGTWATGMDKGNELTQELMLKSCVEAIATALRRSGNTPPPLPVVVPTTKSKEP